MWILVYWHIEQVSIYWHIEQVSIWQSPKPLYYWGFASWPHPQRSSGDVRALGACHPKETLHCCRVTSVVFSSTCSDWTYASHHLLCPLLMTMLAKSETEWAFPQRADGHYIPPPILLCVRALRALIRPVSGKRGGRNTETEATMKAWHEEGLQKLRLFYLCSDQWGW